MSAGAGHVPVWRRPDLAWRIFRLPQQLAGRTRRDGTTAEELGLDQLDAQAVADEFCRDFDRRHIRQAKHIDGQPRRHEFIAAVALLDHKGQEADDDTAVQRIGVPRPVRNLGGNERVVFSGEERLICHGAEP
jgi:hypothetical protein